MAENVVETGENQPNSEEQWQEKPPSGRSRSYFREHPALKWGLLIGGIVVVVALIVVWRYYAVRESTDDAQIDGHITPISARVSGTVVSINYRDNQFVDQGAVLVQLDPKDYQLAIQHAEADLADAKASAIAAGTNIPITHTSTSNQLQNALAARNAAQKQVEVAVARTREAEANYVKTAKDLERMSVLVQKDEVSRQQYDSAVATAASTKAAVDAAHAAVAAAQAQVAQAEAMVRTAQNSAAAGYGDPRASRSGRGAGEARRIHAGAGATESAIHHGSCAGSGRRQQAQRGDWAGSASRPATGGVGADRRCLRDRQLQGNRAQEHAPRAEGYGSRRCLRSRSEGARRQHRRRYRGPLQLASAGERHRQLCEGGAARSGQDRL